MIQISEQTLQPKSNYDQSKELPSLKQQEDTKLTYTAGLFGRTWFNFSHKYSEAEAIEYTKEATAEISAAVRQIYRGDPSVLNGQLQLVVNRPDKKQMRIRWQTDAFKNCINNVKGINTLDDVKTHVIQRVHPNTYQAFITAAFEMQAEEIEISSGWRPMLGSVAHRLGIGLDVTSVKINGTTNKYNRSYISEEIELKNLRNKAAQLKALKNRTPAQDEELKSLQTSINKKSSALPQAIKNSEGNHLKSFSAIVRKNKEVRQTLDPWEIDINTHDNILPNVNTLKKDGTQWEHRHHLHITVSDPEIGF